VADNLLPMSRWLSLCLVAPLVVLAACDRSAEVKTKLESSGYEDVEVTKAGDAYEFTAKKDGLKCKGKVTIEGNNAKTTASCSL
jgi:hypothetical protein